MSPRVSKDGNSPAGSSHVFLFFCLFFITHRGLTQVGFSFSFVTTVNDFVQYLFIGCLTLSGGVWCFVFCFFVFGLAVP